MKLLQKYLNDNAQLEVVSDSSESTYWRMYGKKWRVSSHINVRPYKNQILYQEYNNRSVLVLNGSITIFNTFKELQEALDAVKKVSYLIKRENPSMIQKDVDTPCVNEDVINNDINEVLSSIIKKTNYKCLKLSSIEQAMLKYLKV